MLTRFRTDATTLHVHYELTSGNLAMPHMPATGVSGLDLYARDSDNRWKWVAVLPPHTQVVQQKWISGLAPGKREYAVYLPLYNGVKFLKIGVGSDAQWESLPPRTEKPIVFYGTSITHGACASRPGMAHVAILGRRLDRPVVNLGFSGSGTMDLPVAELMGEVDAAVFVIDCLPNMNADEVQQRTVPFITKLRELRPASPIILVEDRSYSGSWIIPSQRDRNATSRNALAGQMKRLLELGYKDLYYLPGESLLGADRDDTTDGSHPSDLGFIRHADAFEPVLRNLLSSK
jgi:lysophospholipase L1-like esterase